MQKSILALSFIYIKKIIFSFQKNVNRDNSLNLKKKKKRRCSLSDVLRKHTHREIHTN